MFDRLKSTGKSTISTLSHLLFGRKMNTDHDPVLPSERQPVSVYAEKLVILSKSMGTKTLQSYKVTQADHLKSDKLSKHESMRVHVRDPKHQKSYIIFERAGGEPTHHVSSPELLQPSRNASKVSISSASDSCSPNLKAQDVVFPMQDEKLRRGDELVGTLTFKDDRLPSLYEVAHLADIVHNASPSYLLFTNNCSHFVDTILLVLTEMCSPHTQMGKSAGKFYGLDLKSGCQADIQSLCTRVKEAVNVSVRSFIHAN